MHIKLMHQGWKGGFEPLVLNGILPWPFGIKGGCRVSSRHPWWVARPVAVVLFPPARIFFLFFFI